MKFEKKIIIWYNIGVGTTPSGLCDALPAPKDHWEGGMLLYFFIHYDNAMTIRMAIFDKETLRFGTLFLFLLGHTCL